MDCIKGLQTLSDQSVHCCITSPPYWGLRDYGVEGQIGLEDTPEEYVLKIVEVFREVRRVLRDDGTLWINLGDSYWANRSINGLSWNVSENAKSEAYMLRSGGKKHETLKPKDMVGIPWRVAFALQADGWYLRSDIIWDKPNAMPESVKDRPAKAHEYIFLLSKKPKYYYDHEAIKERRTSDEDANGFRGGCYVEGNMDNDSLGKREIKGNIKDSFYRQSTRPLIPGQRSVQHRPDREPINYSGTRNKRTVWTVATKAFAEAHFATFPPELIKPCILAGSPEGGVVLDPFMGAATTAVTAIELRRNYLGIELSDKYWEMGVRRTERAKRRRDSLGIPLFSEGV